MFTIGLTETRIQELEKELEKEIKDYQNKIICREKFIYLIKRCSIMEFCYLYEKYIGKIESVRRMPEITFSDNDYIETVNEYNNITKTITYPKKNSKKLVRIENMAQKKNYYRRHK